MESYKAAFKDLVDQLTTYAESIEEQNVVLKQALRDLLNEDDIKELPAYQLLKNTYEPYLATADVSASLSKSKSKSKSKANASATATPPAVFTDPLHAPPGARFSSKNKASENIRRPIIYGATNSATEDSKPSSSDHYSDQMPDMDSCLLGAPPPKTKAPPPKINAASSTSLTTKREIRVSPKEGEAVYQVEIQGKKYLRYNDNFYDVESKQRVKTIAELKLGQTESPIELEPVPEYPDYYWSQANSDTAYILVNGEIAQAVGTYENGELALWS